MKNKPTTVAMVTGFLGSGKTTVLNDVLTSMAGRKVAVVVNEWGSQGVDGALLLDPSGIGITELPGGQIFCTCLAGTFVKAIERLLGMELELVLVETSGLARPAGLGQLLALVESRSPGCMQYAGLTCVIDAERFHILRSVAVALEEQINYADRFIISKTDLVDAAALAGIRDSLIATRPGATIIERAGKPVDSTAILGADEGEAITASETTVPPQITTTTGPGVPARWRGWGKGGRPRSSTLIPETVVSRQRLMAFLSSIASQTWRIKGFCMVDDQSAPILVDAVGTDIILKPVDPVSQRGLTRDRPALGLTIIWSATATDLSSLRACWYNQTGTAATIHHS